SRPRSPPSGTASRATASRRGPALRACSPRSSPASSPPRPRSCAARPTASGASPDLRWTSRSPEGPRAAARAPARAPRRRRRAVVVVGPVGAGKPACVQGVAEGVGLDGAPVVSPTFVLASEYGAPGGPRLAHVDLYRIESAGELEAAGFRDLLAPD